MLIVVIVVIVFLFFFMLIDFLSLHHSVYTIVGCECLRKRVCVTRS